MANPLLLHTDPVVDADTLAQWQRSLEHRLGHPCPIRASHRPHLVFVAFDPRRMGTAPILEVAQSLGIRARIADM